jgi:hypothetical protein
LLLLIQTQFIKTGKKQDLTPLFDDPALRLTLLLTTLYGGNKISGDAMKALVLKRRIVNVSRK